MDIEQSEEAQVLTRVVSDVLGIKEVDINDRYLDLGGNSVSLYLIIEKVNEMLDIDLNPQVFFDPECTQLKCIVAEIKRCRTKQNLGA